MSISTTSSLCSFTAAWLVSKANYVKQQHLSTITNSHLKGRIAPTQS